MPALVTNSKIWGEMFGTKEMHFLFSDESTTQLYLDVEAAASTSKYNCVVLSSENKKCISLVPNISPHIFEFVTKAGILYFL